MDEGGNSFCSIREGEVALRDRGEVKRTSEKVGKKLRKSLEKACESLRTDIEIIKFITSSRHRYHIEVLWFVKDIAPEVEIWVF